MNKGVFNHFSKSLFQVYKNDWVILTLVVIDKVAWFNWDPISQRTGGFNNFKIQRSREFIISSLNLSSNKSATSFDFSPSRHFLPRSLNKSIPLFDQTVKVFFSFKFQLERDFPFHLALKMYYPLHQFRGMLNKLKGRETTYFGWLGSFSKGSLSQIF